MPLATIGVFLLWFGWYGFNGGSVLSADPGAVSYVIVTTTLAAAAGILGAMVISWIVSKKPDLSMVLNGSLAGLVGITAGADVISPLNSVIVGFIAGIFVFVSVLFFDRLKIDDPVGAISVHLICGIWGTLAVGIFTTDYSFMTQLIGVVSYGVASFLCAFILFYTLNLVMNIRVSEEEELKGLDIGEHEMESYAGFQIFTVE
jgi:Amt family ammonium transporter